MTLKNYIAFEVLASRYSRLYSYSKYSYLYSVYLSLYSTFSLHAVGTVCNWAIKNSHPVLNKKALYICNKQFYVNLLSIDGTNASQYGAFVNDSPYGNCVMKKVELLNGSKRLCLFAVSPILPNTELRYNYGDKSLWWRKKVYSSLLIYHLISRQH